MKLKIISIALIIICFLVLVYSLQSMNIKIKKLEMEKALIFNQKSEIEIIKETFDKNKEVIRKSKETMEKAKTIYEKSVWLDRCLTVKLVDNKENCEKNLERFAVFQ
jgi:hypothetical protein